MVVEVETIVVEIEVGREGGCSGSLSGSGRGSGSVSGSGGGGGSVSGSGSDW